MQRKLMLTLVLVLLLCTVLTPLGAVADEPGDAYVYFMPLLIKLWTVDAPALTVRIDDALSQFDPPDDDRQDLNQEYVCFRNEGAAGVQMGGCSVQDAAGCEYVFSALVLASGATVTLHTGSGEDSATDLYWGMGRPVWNNDGDTVSLYDAQGVLVDQYTY